MIRYSRQDMNRSALFASFQIAKKNCQDYVDPITKISYSLKTFYHITTLNKFLATIEKFKTYTDLF